MPDPFDHLFLFQRQKQSLLFTEILIAFHHEGPAIRTSLRKASLMGVVQSGIYCALSSSAPVLSIREKVGLAFLPHSDGFSEHPDIKRHPEQQEGLERNTWKGYPVNGKLNEIQPVEHQVNRLGEK